MSRSASVDHSEVQLFSSHASDWWNPNGAFRPLHKLNPSRLEYICNSVQRHFPDKTRQGLALSGLTALDLGCGGGLLCEPMARLGADVTGLDASVPAIEIAKSHAQSSNLKIKYLATSVEELSRSNRASTKFDLITALEILEHVADVKSFLASAVSLLSPKGLLVLSTINRTPKSFVLGIVAAEYLLNWVPQGTHDWRKFLRPSELSQSLKLVGLKVTDITGVVYDPFNSKFDLRPENVGMNYLMSASPGASILKR